jgi:hypothetical protein
LLAVVGGAALSVDDVLALAAVVTPCEFFVSSDVVDCLFSISEARLIEESVGEAEPAISACALQ